MVARDECRFPFSTLTPSLMSPETPLEEAQTPDTIDDSAEQNEKPWTPSFLGNEFFLCHPAQGDGIRPIVEQGREALKKLPPDQEIIEMRVVETGRGTGEIFPMRRKVADCLKGAFTLNQYFDQQEKKS